MAKYIITRNAWGDGMKAETSMVPELILPFEKLKAKCREIGVEFITIPEWKEGMDVICAFFIDCPPENDPLVAHWVDRGIPKMFLMIAENLFLQPNKTYAAVSEFADVIFSYEQMPHLPDKTVELRYPVDLEAAIKSRQGSLYNARQYLAGMIASNKSSGFMGDLYRKRTDYGLILDLRLGDRFALYGNGWPGRASLPCGPHEKHLLYSKCEFAIVLENNRSIPGYVTEKLFNALAAGCIPIYEYADTGEIPPEIFINARDYPHPLALMEKMDSMTLQEKKVMIDAGTEFLQNDACRWSEGLYVETVLEEIRGIL